MTVSTYTWPAQSLNAIALSQADPPQGQPEFFPPETGPFPINEMGTPLQLILNGSIGNGPFNGFARTVTLTSAADISALTFTVNGSCLGFPVTETLTGPDTTTVATTTLFDQVYSITYTPSLALDEVSAGIGGTGFLSFFPTNLYDTWPVVTVNVDMHEDAANMTWSLCGVFEKSTNPADADNLVTYEENESTSTTTGLVSGTSPGFPIPYVFLSITDTSTITAPNADNIITLTYVATNR